MNQPGGGADSKLWGKFREKEVLIDEVEHSDTGQLENEVN